MRVTELQTFGVLANNLARARARALVFQQQVSTGKLVRQPSDDPSTFNHISMDKASLSLIEQWQRNIVFGRTRLDLSDNQLTQVTNTLARVQQLAVQFRGGANGVAERSIGAQEVRQLFAQLQQSANTELNGQPIFTGTSTHGRATGLSLTAPVTLTNGANDTILLAVDGVTSGTIDLTSGTESLSGSQLATRLQSQINADSVLANAGKSVTVTFEQDHLVIASNSNGPESTVGVTGGLARGVLGFLGGSQTTGDVPFALTATVAAASGNTGGAVAGQGRVVDGNAVTLDDYLIRFTSATTYDVLNVTVPVTATRGSSNAGGAAIQDAGVRHADQLTLHNYQIQFTSTTQYSIVDQTTSTTVSSGNTYVSGDAISFGGLRVVLGNSEQGGPQAGDTFSISLTPRNVLTNQTYISGSDIAFNGIRMTLTNATGSPASGDMFSIVSGLQYQGDTEIQAVEIGPGQTVPTNVVGDRAFTGGTSDIFSHVKQLVSSLRGNFRLGITEALGGLGSGISQAAAVLGELGATSNRLETTDARLIDAKGFFQQTLSETEDVDMAKAISDLTLQQYAIEAASRTLTKVFENSLLNYL
ncbi:MAG: flagellin [Nitrospira sp.]|nr:flagellin [Nitrospira sp.]MDH4302523.1 flagellin [Nitrospira sp.]MDH5192367.1 flagellin [Nitrospira sp.]